MFVHMTWLLSNRDEIVPQWVFGGTRGRFGVSRTQRIFYEKTNSPPRLASEPGNALSLADEYRSMAPRMQPQESANPRGDGPIAHKAPACGEPPTLARR